ncbi:MAG TPA: hypothetical protein VF159_12335 [Gemmatimonadaceae bacterium]
MRILCFPALVALAACAPSQPSTIAPRPKTTTIAIGGLNTQVTIHNEGDEVTGYAIAAPIDRAWNILPQLYRSWGLSLTQIDQASRTVRGQRLRSRQYFLGKPLGDYFDCGTVAGVPNVGRYELDMDVATQLRPGARDSTLVQTVVSASAKPGGTAGDPFRCDANQKIAERIAGALASALASPPAPR